VVLAGGCLLLEAVGLVILAGNNPLADAVARRNGETPAAGIVRGAKFDYCLELPPKGWYLRGDDLAHKDNPLSDRWFTRPDSDAHVMIIAEKAQGPVNQKRLENVLEDDARSRLTDLKLLPREPLPNGAALHYTGTAQNISFEYLRGAFADGDRAFQVIAFSTTQDFAQNRDEMLQMLRSFQPTCARAR
jgi:hypothetical protein